jgi:hypothetical protein
MSLMKWLSLVCLVFLAGCVAMPAKDSLGVTGVKGNKERPFEAVSMQFSGSVFEVDGYKIPIPPEWQDREVVCRTFENLEGKSVEACRKTSRVFLDGAKYSAFIRDGNWYVFAPKGTKFNAAVFPPAEGEDEQTESLIVKKGDVRKLDSSEIRAVYERIADTFPLQSKPIDDSGVSVLFGREAIEVLMVPTLTTPKERMWYCGVLSISSNELIALAHGNPMAALPKLWALACSAMTKPNLLVKASERNSIEKMSESTAFRGD